jgi:hypothetical protein
MGISVPEIILLASPKQCSSTLQMSRPIHPPTIMPTGDKTEQLIDINDPVDI